MDAFIYAYSSSYMGFVIVFIPHSGLFSCLWYWLYRRTFSCLYHRLVRPLFSFLVTGYIDVCCRAYSIRCRDDSCHSGYINPFLVNILLYLEMSPRPAF
jgi:hypothetical protein